MNIESNGIGPNGQPKNPRQLLLEQIEASFLAEVLREELDTLENFANKMWGPRTHDANGNPRWRTRLLFPNTEGMTIGLQHQMPIAEWMYFGEQNVTEVIRIVNQGWYTLRRKNDNQEDFVIFDINDEGVAKASIEAAHDRKTRLLTITGLPVTYYN